MSEETKNTTATNGSGTGTEAQNQEEKLFTQKDVDGLIARRLAREKAKLPSDVDLQEFREWKKANAKEGETSSLEEDNKRLKAELEHLRAEQAVLRAQAKPEFAEFVASKVLSIVNENTTLQQAVEKYKKENPQFFGETVVKRVSTAFGLRNDSKGTTTNDIMNNLLRNRGKN